MAYCEHPPHRCWPQAFRMEGMGHATIQVTAAFAAAIPEHEVGPHALAHTV